MREAPCLSWLAAFAVLVAMEWAEHGQETEDDYEADSSDELEFGEEDELLVLCRPVCKDVEGSEEDKRDSDGAQSQEEVLACPLAAPQMCPDPSPVPKKKKKKKKDPNAAERARRRVCQKFQEERRAARRARKREMARATRRRGANVDIEAFLEKTRQRLEAKAVEAEVEAAQASAEAAAAAAEAAQYPGGSEQAKQRLLVRTAMEKRALSAQEAAMAAKAAARAACIDLEEFQKKTQARVMQRLWEKLPQARDGCAAELGSFEGGCAGAHFTRRRIAVVGAGPVGLWAALLLADKHSKIGDGCRVRRPDAPDIVILEGRPEEKHCTRTDIRIALSSPTQSLLNQRTGSRCFSSGMPLAEIEAALLRRWRKLCPRDAVTFGRCIDDPGALTSLEGFDCVLWAAGRRSLDVGPRQRLGCETRLGHSERVLVFQIDDLVAGDAWQLVSLDLTGVVRQAAKCPTLRVMVRPGLGGACACWVWLFGLPPGNGACSAVASAAAAATNAYTAGSRHLNSMGEAFSAAIAGGAPDVDVEVARAAVDTLQQRVRPAACSARWVDAAFWSSDRVVCQLPGPDDSTAESRPLVLLGDAACGKPFYTGTTLNKHFWEVAALIDEVEWPYDGTPLVPGTFESHERRYQTEIRRIADFQRRGTAVPRPLQPLRQGRSPGSLSPKVSPKEASIFPLSGMSGGSFLPRLVV